MPDGIARPTYTTALGNALALGMGGFLVGALLFQLPVQIVLDAFGIGLRSPVGYSALTLFQELGFAAAVGFYVFTRTAPDLLSVRWPSLSRPRRTVRDLGLVLLGIVVLFLAAQAIDRLLGAFFDVAAGENQVEALGREHPSLLLAMIALSVLAVGPGEELLFRGGVQGVLRQVFSPIPAVVLSSALFGLAHTTAVVTGGTSGVLGYVVTTFLLGLVLGTLYEYSSNLLVSILVHGAYNATLFALLYLRVAG